MKSPRECSGIRWPNKREALKTFTGTNTEMTIRDKKDAQRLERKTGCGTTKEA